MTLLRTLALCALTVTMAACADPAEDGTTLDGEVNATNFVPGTADVDGFVDGVDLASYGTFTAVIRPVNADATDVNVILVGCPATETVTEPCHFPYTCSDGGLAVFIDMNMPKDLGAYTAPDDADLNLQYDEVDYGTLDFGADGELLYGDFDGVIAGGTEGEAFGTFQDAALCTY